MSEPDDESSVEPDRWPDIACAKEEERQVSYRCAGACKARESGVSAEESGVGRSERISKQVVSRASVPVTEFEVPRTVFQ